MGAVGFRASVVESPRLLAVFEVLATLSLGVWAAGLGGAVAAVDYLPKTVEDNCDAVVRFLAQGWWDSWIGCRKYASDGMRGDTDVRGAGEGWSVRCADASKNAYAWEYNAYGRSRFNDAGQETEYYGCLNSQQCCGLLAERVRTNRFLLVYFGLVTFFLLAALVRGARYLRRKVASRHSEVVLNHRNTTVALIVCGLTCFGLVALGLRASALAGRARRAAPAHGLGKLKVRFDVSPDVPTLPALSDADLVSPESARCVVADAFGRDYVPYPTAAPTGSARPTYPVPTPAPSFLPIPAPSRRPSTAGPSLTPTAAPSSEPTTAGPSSAPAARPSGAPTSVPTSAPSRTPSNEPSRAPTSSPTASPTGTPTSLPTTAAPTSVPWKPARKSTGRPTWAGRGSAVASATDRPNGTRRNRGP